MNGVMRKLGKKSISVTDISAQYWCEKKMELEYIYGSSQTKAEKVGKKIHELLENKINIQVDLEPKSYADFVYKTLYTNYIGISELLKSKKTREVNIFGRIGGISLRGKIDQLHMKDGAIIILENKTKSKTEPPYAAQLLTHRVQVILYRKMLEDLRSEKYTIDMFRDDYWIKNLKLTKEFEQQISILNIPSNIREIDGISKNFFNIIKSLPKISNTLYIRYSNQFTEKLIKMYKLNYTDKEYDELMSYSLKYWNGLREALTVPENEQWKCKFCSFFGNKCKVWYTSNNVKI
ncbi:MAG: exonuclease V [Candidatus Marsarchaeota archaeon]|nr:exonuclease V [Candidatus Marsarchaeota archaeon]